MIFVRGEVYRLRAPRDAQRTEQRGPRYAVVVQSDDLPLSTWIVCPTSTSAQPAPYRPEVNFGAGLTKVMIDQMMAINPQRLGDHAGYVRLHEMQAIEHAMRLILGLDR